MQSLNTGAGPQKTGTQVSGPGPADRNPSMELKTKYTTEVENSLENPHTLESYSYDNFSSPGKLWQYSKKHIDQPLLKYLLDNEAMARKACQCYSAILTYMGEQPTRRNRTGNYLTDKIFAPAMQNMCLRDELFCQIIKQLTHDDEKPGPSDEKGWELMWLITACFAPSNKLQKEVSKFLRSNLPSYKEFQNCFDRLEETQRTGPRRYPPHQMEVEAIQEKRFPIMFKVQIPSGLSLVVEVHSRTKVEDIAEDVTRTLCLKSTEGFTLNIMIGGQYTRVPEGYFLFDLEPHLKQWHKRYRSDRNEHQIMVMKNFWANTIPGEDIIADVLFHYNQEMTSYMSHHLEYTTDEAAQIAAYIYRANYGNDDLSLSNIEYRRHLTSLVPRDLITTLSPQEWNQKIKTFYYRDSCQTRQDAKIAFLQLLYQRPTFGSQFFPVTQTTDTNIPQYLVVAINHYGLTLIEEDTKEILVKYRLRNIVRWNSDYLSINLEFGDGKQLFCRTSYGPWMEELLNTYIDHTRM